VKQAPYITCRELIDFMAAYLAGELTEAQKHEFDRHLNVCPSCVAYLESYKRTIRLGQMAFTPSDEPAPIPEALDKAIKTARARLG
jgi:anti-sigma factor RsiW